MMHLSLRTRLLASYLLLLAITLGVITLALFLFLGTRPISPRPTYDRLAAYAQGLNLFSLVSTLDDNLTIQARNIRVLHVLVSSEENQVIALDTAGNFAAGDKITLRLDDYTVPRLELLLPLRSRQVFGSFDDPDGSEWLFGGAAIVRRDGNLSVWVLAEARPVQSLQETLADLGVTLGMPLIQAALVGLVIAVGLAFFISRSIAHPLQAVARAAKAVAEGHFDERVPTTGPPEVRAVSEAFNRMSAEVRANQEAQRDFLANVSHDLKTPLTSIQGYSQAIMDGTARDPAQAAAIIHEEAGRLNRMVIELTDLARIQAGRLSMQTTAIDMGQIAAAIGQRLAVVAQKKGVELHVDTGPMPVINGDGDRLAQVLVNLISNAIKYTPTGGSVWVTTRVNDGGVEVLVQDTGVGIPAQDLPRVFERFYQVDKTRGPKRGTGLGLAITAEIVQAHGGKISVSSPGENQGTTFSVWFPSPQMTTVAARSRR